jgi:FkbM family methyltransferase
MLLKQKVIRLLYPHGSVRRVLRGPLRGMRFSVVPGMGGSFAIGMDCWNFRFLGPKIKPGMTIYDIGANCGQMALFFARMTGQAGRVYSFEPVPENVKCLRYNMEINELKNVMVMPVALGSATGDRSFVFDAASHTMGSFDGLTVKMPGASGTLTVPCRTIDELVSEGLPKPDLIKLDVEGAGGEVLDGASHTIERWRPPIYFELHAATDKSPELLMLQRLKKEWGYRTVPLDSSLGEEPGPMWGAAVWCAPPPTGCAGLQPARSSTAP